MTTGNIPHENLQALLRGNKLNAYQLALTNKEYENLVLNKGINCTHCYGTGKDHGDETGKTECPSCKIN